MQKRPMVVVVGGGIAGLEAAANLAERGVSVTLIERESQLGGNGLTVCCKAIDGVCQLCGGCLLAERLSSAGSLPLVQILLETTVARFDRTNGGFSVSLSGANAPQDPIVADAVVVATGFDHVDAHTKGPYGYGILPMVTTGEEMERRLRLEGQGAYDGLGAARVAFVQCVGSRDEHAGRGYCSQVCCRYAVRLARLLKARNPELQVSIFKMDIQNGGRDFAACWQAASSDGIRFVAGLPAVVRRSDEAPAAATFIYDDILGGAVAREAFDLVVLSVGMQPRSDAPQVADALGINLDRFGFFAAGDDETSTLVSGVFVAGSCQAPRSLAESAAHARSAAEACYRYVTERRQPTPVSKDVAVFGGTPEGRRATQELLDLGYAVHWIALPGDAAQALPEHPHLTFLADGMPARVSGHVGGFDITVGRNGDTRTLTASAVVVATGNARAAALPKKGIASASRVLNLGQLAARLDAPRDTGAAVAHRNLRVLMVLDMERAAGAEMTAEAFALAERVRREWRSEVYVLYRDLLVDTPGMEAATRRMREQGIVFCRYDDGAVMADDEGVAVDYVEGRLAGDLLVIPEAVRPRDETAALAALLKVTVGEDGYLQDVNIHQLRPGITVRRGVFAAGRCHADLSRAAAEADAVQAAASVDALLGAGVLMPEGAVAEVDSAKCVRCLTCVRTCPHAAVEIITMDDVTAAHVSELACWGCGACVGNCPVQAITLNDQTWPAWMPAVQ